MSRCFSKAGFRHGEDQHEEEQLELAPIEVFESHYFRPQVVLVVRQGRNKGYFKFGELSRHFSETRDNLILLGKVLI